MGRERLRSPVGRDGMGLHDCLVGRGGKRWANGSRKHREMGRERNRDYGRATNSAIIGNTIGKAGWRQQTVEKR